MYIYIVLNNNHNNKNKNIMTTTYNNHGFTISFNNSATYFILDSNNDCWGTYSTERKAKNAMKKILSCQNKEY